MKQDERCTRCGGEIFPNAGEQWPDGWIHSEPNNCYLTALARAEAAEADNRRLAARVAELEARLASDAADENQWLDAYIESAAKDGATIKRLMARVAELEAALVSDSELDTGPFNTLGRVIAERNRLAARVAELESQAAQQWRPVTEKPTDDGRYLIGWDYDEEAGAEVGDYMAAADMWFYQGAPATPTHWRPRPIPPLPNEVQP